MPFCTYCGQSFTRDEHLERHILTHTNVKPYKCLTCHMSFARRDLLQRHYVVHGKDANQEPLAGPHGLLAKTAGRTPIACHNCAKTKTKCDKKFPCTRCSTRGLTCTVRPTRRATKNSAIAQQLEEQSAACNGVDGASSNSSRDDSTRSSPDESSTSGQTTQPSSRSGTMHPSQSWEDFQKMAIDRRETPKPRPSSASVAMHPSESWESFQSAASNAQQTPSKAPSAQMSSMTFEDLDTSNNRDHDEFMTLGPGPDGFAIPLPSPLLPDGQAMMDWTNMPYQFDTHQAEPQSDHGFSANNQSFDHSMFMTPFDGSFGANMHPSEMSIDPTSLPPLSNHQQQHCFSDHTSAGNDAYRVLDSDPSQRTDPAVIEALAAAHDAWSVFRCNPCVPSSQCPKTARLNLEILERSLKDDQMWSAYNPQWQEPDIPGLVAFDIKPMQDMLRDRLLAITQTFLHKALDTHKDDMGSPERRNSGASFMSLPPTRNLELFLRTYSKSSEQYYSVTPRGTLNVNEIMRNNHDRAASLLILLMIAQGASVTPGEGQSLTAGLTEACRISLFDVVEKNIMMASDQVVLHSALLFTLQAAWSGDKWQMDIASGQRGMYINMLRHSGRMEPRTPRPHDASSCSLENLWQEWLEQEGRSRLAYAWCMVDAEVSIFHDTAPMFSVTEFGEALPSPDLLWHSKTAEEWAHHFEQTYDRPTTYASIGPDNRPLSLRGLFRTFLDDGIVAKRLELTPLHLRLLLQPLQCLVYQARQLLSCFPDKSAPRRGSKNVSSASTKGQLREASTLLQRWYSLADRYIKTKPACPTMQANLITFHLISLNVVTAFPEIEQLARRDEGELSDQRLPALHRRCVNDTEEAIVHCGQILRLTRAMNPTVRPPWWAASIYRVALVFWTISLNIGDSLGKRPGTYPSYESSFQVDTDSPQSPMIARYLTEKEGTPLLTKGDGSTIPTDDPLSLLLHCTQIISEGVATRFTDGLRLKLSRLAKDGSR